MRTLAVILALLVSIVLSANCYSQVQAEASTSDDERFSNLASADTHYADKSKALDRAYNEKLQALNSAYQADREQLQKKQIKLLESGKSAAMRNEDLDGAIAIRDRINELQSAEPAKPNATDFSTVWRWDEYPNWMLVFQGNDQWIEGDRSHWTETGRSRQCIHLHDEERNMFGMLYNKSFFYRRDFEDAWTMVSGNWLRNEVKPEAESSHLEH